MHFLLAFRNALSFADVALVFRHFAAAETARTCARCCEVAEECISGFANVSLSVARTARFALRSLFSARAVACSAHAHFSDEHPALRSEYGFTEREFNVNRNVAASSASRSASSAPAKKLSENIAKVKLLGAEVRASLRKIREIETTKSSAGSTLTPCKRSAVRVVLRPLFLVGKHGIRLARLLDFLFVSTFLVGMVF